MPPYAKVSKEDILAAALFILKKHGADAINARALANRIGCSTQPIFSNFSNMEDLKYELLNACAKRYRTYLKQELILERYPEYKASGMAYIRFAREEKELFKFLFMRDRSGETTDCMEEDFTDSVYYIHKELEISYDDAIMFHTEMWVFVHGIATMLATSYLDLTYDEISMILSDAYLGLRMRYESKKGENQNDHCN
jgi:AcrR family transcriptional regulator